MPAPSGTTGTSADWLFDSEDEASASGSFPFTIPNGSSGVVVGAYFDSGTAQTHTALTIDGISARKLEEGGNRCSGALYILGADEGGGFTTGSSITIAWTLSGIPNNNGPWFVVFAFKDSDATNPERASAVNAITSGAMSNDTADFTSTVDDLLVGINSLHTNSAGMAIDSGNSDLDTMLNTTNIGGEAALATGVGQATAGKVGFDWTTSRQSTNFGVSLQQPSGVTDLAIAEDEIDEANVRGTFTNAPPQVELHRNTSSPATAGAKIQDLSGVTEWIDNAANSTVGPSPNTIYFWQTSEASGANPSNEETHVTAPAQPTLQAFTPLSPTSLSIEATFGAGATHGIIYYRKKEIGGGYTTIVQPVADFNFILVGLEEGTAYEGFIIARNDTDNVESGVAILIEGTTSVTVTGGGKPAMRWLRMAAELNIGL